MNSKLRKRSKTTDSPMILENKNAKTTAIPIKNQKSLGIPKLRLKKDRNSSNFTVAQESNVEDEKVVQPDTAKYKLRNLEIRVKKLSQEEIDRLILASGKKSPIKDKPTNNEVNKPSEKKQNKMVKKTALVKRDRRNSISDPYSIARQANKILNLETKKSDNHLTKTKDTVKEKPSCSWSSFTNRGKTQKVLEAPQPDVYDIVGSITKKMDANTIRIPKKKKPKTPEKVVTSVPAEEPCTTKPTRYFNPNMFNNVGTGRGRTNFLDTSRKFVNSSGNVITGLSSETNRLILNEPDSVNVEDSSCETKFSRLNRKRRIDSDASEDDDDSIENKPVNLSDNECDENVDQLTETETVTDPEVPEIDSAITQEPEQHPSSVQKDSNPEELLSPENHPIETEEKIDALNHLNCVEEYDIELNDSDTLSLCLSDSDSLDSISPQKRPNVLEKKKELTMKPIQEKVEHLRNSEQSNCSAIAQTQHEVPRINVNPYTVLNTAGRLGAISKVNDVIPPNRKPLFPPLIKKPARKQNAFDVHPSDNDEDSSGDVIFNQICKEFIQMKPETVQQVRTSVEVLTNLQLQALYENQMCKNSELFKAGFPMVALEMGTRKMKSRLTNAIHECEKQKMLTYWKYVIDGLEKSGMERKDALFTLIRNHKKRTFDAIDVILELIAFSSFDIVTQLLPNIQKFLETQGYKMKEKTVERLIYLLNTNGYPDVLNCMLKVLLCDQIEELPRTESTQIFTTRLSNMMAMLSQWIDNDVSEN